MTNVIMSIDRLKYGNNTEQTITNGQVVLEPRFISEEANALAKNKVLA
jgi:hypothetical protein